MIGATSLQQSLPGISNCNVPTLHVLKKLTPDLSTQLALAGLDRLPDIEVWQIDHHSRALAYSSHGIARFFGKFPPPIARHFLEKYTKPGDKVLDPMCGSGTSVLEGLLENRDVVGFDINPVAITIASAKVTRLRISIVPQVLERIAAMVPRVRPSIPDSLGDLRYPDHWFLPETMDGLARIRRSIEILSEEFPSATEMLWASLAAIIRQCSKATSQQGRLFLDVNSAVCDPVPTFLKRLEANLIAVSSLPRSAQTLPKLGDACRRIASVSSVAAAIIHPPYFNSYKYSSVFSLEMAWLGFPRKDVAGAEVRESFKQGKKARLDHYISDMHDILAATRDIVKPRGMIGIMLGDTVLCDKYVRVATEIISKASDLGLTLKVLAIRPPRYTEASWVTSQRRSASALGAKISDYFLVFQRT